MGCRGPGPQVGHGARNVYLGCHWRGVPITVTPVAREAAAEACGLRGGRVNSGLCNFYIVTAWAEGVGLCKAGTTACPCATTRYHPARGGGWLGCGVLGTIALLHWGELPPGQRQQQRLGMVEPWRRTGWMGWAGSFGAALPHVGSGLLEHHVSAPGCQLRVLPLMQHACLSILHRLPVALVLRVSESGRRRWPGGAKFFTGQCLPQRTSRREPN